MSIYISGSLAFDRVMTFPGKFEDYILPHKIHILNVCFPIERMEEKFGGTAGNIAYSLALLGEKPIIISQAGKDFDRYKAHLENLGLSLDGINIYDDDFTAAAFITSDISDNQITGFCQAAMTKASKYTLPALNPEQDFAIVSPGNLTDMEQLPELYKKHNIPYIFDPSQQIPIMSSELLLKGITGAYALICNDYELEMILKVTKKSKAELLTLCKFIITTLAELGSLYEDQAEEKTYISVVPPLNVSDPTGAGDALRAGLLYGLTHKKSLKESLQLGSTLASFCIEKYGTQEHKFNQEEFYSRYHNTFKD